MNRNTDRKIFHSERYNKAMKDMKTEIIDVGSEPVWEWFELSYASYVALPRIVLQAMPKKWQKKFVNLMNELDETIDWRRNHCYVKFRDSKGRFVKDEFDHYKHFQPPISEINKIVEDHNAK